MSASSMPTLRPRSRKPSARLTAVVDLPTPPLPEATAITASTPGTPGCTLSAGWAARCGAPPARLLLRLRAGSAGGALGGQGHQRRLHAGNGADGVFGGLAHRLPGLHRGGVDRDGEKHLAVADDDIGQDFRLRQRSAAGRRHLRQCRQHLLLAHRHDRTLPALFRCRGRRYEAPTRDGQCGRRPRRLTRRPGSDLWGR